MNISSPNMSYITCVFYVLWHNHCKNVFHLGWVTKVTSHKTTYTEGHYIRDGITQHAGLNGIIQYQNFICWVLTTPCSFIIYCRSQIWYVWEQIKKMARVYNVLSCTFQTKLYLFIYFYYQIISALVAAWSMVWVLIWQQNKPYS